MADEAATPLTKTAEGDVLESDAAVARAMTALQLLGIAWVVLNQFRFHLGLHAGERFGLVGKGYIGASLFFLASGYLAFHSYGRAPLRLAEWRANLWRRFSAIYPLHLLVLASMAAGFIAAGVVGEAVRTRFPSADLPANLLLVQAWGVLKTDTWNFPSWLVSADWLAWLALPLLLRAQQAMRSDLMAVVAPLVLFVVGFLVADRLGILFTDMTARAGALQMFPAFMLGAGLWRMRDRLRLSGRAGLGVAAASAAWIAVASTLRASDLAIWPAFAPLAIGFGAAARGHTGSREWSATDIALTLQLIYLPVDILYFRMLRPFTQAASVWALWLIWAGVFPVIALATAGVWYGFQRPVARWLGRRGRPAL